MYKVPERGGGGRGNSGNARKKTFFFSGGVPLVKPSQLVFLFFSWQLLKLHLLPAGPDFKLAYTAKPGQWLQQ